MTAIANLPDLRPSLLLDFANSGRVDPRIQCTRASAATCFGPDGKLRTLAANVPRIDYDPATGKCLGLLVEEPRANLLTYSNNFENSAWLKNGTTFTKDLAIAPDGTMTAGKLVETAENRSHVIYANLVVANGPATLSFFVKEAGRSKVRLNSYEASIPSNPVSATFDLVAKTASSFGGLTTSASIKDVGGGWLRCQVSGLSGGTASTWTLTILGPGDATTYAGDGVSGVFMWGAQVEVGSFPTSHIPTAGSAVTRAADAPYVTPIASPWFSASAGTLTVSYDYGAPEVINMVALGLDGGSSSNAISLATTSGNTDRFIVTSNGAGAFNSGFNPFTPGVRKTTGLTWGNRRISQSANGGAVSSVTDKDLPVDLNRITLGHSGYFSQSRSNGHIAKLAYYPVPVTDSQLQRLTA